MLFYIGLATIGICSSAFAAQVIPTLRQCWRKKTRVERHGVRVRTRISMRNRRMGK